jgi:hypothetical protein
MTSPFADRLFRIAFALAAAYNLAFGLWAALWPYAFFDAFEIPRPLYPGIWACLGMVVGVYGLLYAHAAWKLDTARPIIAVGLLGKVLGPIGMFTSFSADWPYRLGMLCVWNDLIWWLPFSLFLLRGTTTGRRIAPLAPWYCVAMHAAGLVAMATVLRPGTAVVASTPDRAQYIAHHPVGWTFGWTVWMFAATSIIGMYAWWGSRLASSASLATQSAAARWALFAVVIAALGMVGDFTGESLAVFVWTEQAQLGTLPAWAERATTVLTAGIANGLYTLGGTVLMLMTPALPIEIRGCMWVTWMAGMLMTISAFAGWTWGIVAATILLFPFLLIWVFWLGLRWRH